MFLYTKTFNNSLKACFSNKKLSITIQTHPKKFNTVYLLFKKKFIVFLKVIDVNK